MNVVVVLVEPEKPGNIGQVARAIKNYGFDKLVIINPLVKIGTTATRYAVHARDVLDAAEVIHCTEGETGLLDRAREVFERYDLVIGTTSRYYKERTLHRVPVTVDQLVVDMMANEGSFRGKTIAVVFGKESNGLPNTILHAVDMLVTIKTSDAYPSLNLSHAVAIVLHELAKVRDTLGASASPLRSISLAPKLKRDIMARFFDDLIDLTLVPEHKKENTSRVFRSMISRAHLSRREVFLLLGVFRVAVELLKAMRDRGLGPGPLPPASEGG